jgi:hypothetical protein
VARVFGQLAAPASGVGVCEGACGNRAEGMAGTEVMLFEAAVGTLAGGVLTVEVIAAV